MSPSMSRRSSPAWRVTAMSERSCAPLSTVPRPFSPTVATATVATTPTPAMTASLVPTRRSRAERRPPRFPAAGAGGAVDRRPEADAVDMRCSSFLLGPADGRGAGPGAGPAPLWSVGEASDGGAQVGRHPGQLVDGRPRGGECLRGGLGGRGDPGDVLGDLARTTGGLGDRARHLL